MESGLSAFKNKLRRDNQINKKSLSKDDYLEWHRKLLEKSSPGITQVKRNAMGWIEIDK
jgi:predicted metal-binding transcription factor (methanogenesis marker protein 9)